MEIMSLNIIRSLTGLSDDNAVGYSDAVRVVCCTLVRSLISLSLLPADVDDQCSWAGLHQDLWVFLYIKVGPVSCPWEAGINKNNNDCCIFSAKSHEETLSVACLFKSSRCIVVCSRRLIWITDFIAGSLAGSNAFKAEGGGKKKTTKLCLIHSARCVSQVVSMQQLLWWFIFPHCSRLSCPQKPIYNIT